MASVALRGAVKLSSQVKQAVVEVEEYIRREGWPAVPSDIMKVRCRCCLLNPPSPCLLQMPLFAHAMLCL